MSLRDDLRMYYNGTYISALVEDGLRVMHVEDAHASSSDINEASLSGQTYRLNSNGRVVELGMDTWDFPTILPNLPMAGYYKFYELDHPVYVENMVQNRTNRKGFDARHCQGDLGHTRMGHTYFVQMFYPQTFEGRLRRDLIATAQGELHWRGSFIGSYRNTEPTLNDQFAHMRNLVCKLLQISFGGLHLS